MNPVDYSIWDILAQLSYDETRTAICERTRSILNARLIGVISRARSK